GLKYTCKTTITKVFSNYGWYYLSCQFCRKKVESLDSKYMCNSCNSTTTNPTPRFKLQLQVDDLTGTTTLITFEREIQILLPHSVQELIDIELKVDSIIYLYRTFVVLTSFYLQENGLDLIE
ncbi:hypothetical protein GIB67_039490, partial [Kingdonia uniflora]